jgi:hypothetical protein
MSIDVSGRRSGAFPACGVLFVIAVILDWQMVQHHFSFHGAKPMGRFFFGSALFQIVRSLFVILNLKSQIVTSSLMCQPGISSW